MGRKGVFALVVGTRPSFIMAAPIIAAFDDAGAALKVLHSAQHYSENMDDVFFRDLGIRQPDHRLTAQPDQKSPARQIAHIMIGVEDWLRAETPQALMVLGDTNSNLGAALATRKLNVPLAHVEAGERSGDLAQAEEQNRRLIDHMADVNFATNARSCANLKAEGIPDARILITGNPIVDAVLKNRDKAAALDLSDRPYSDNLKGKFGVMTLHRQENVDDPDRLPVILRDIQAGAAAAGAPVIFFAHPRTLARINEQELMPGLESDPNIMILPGAGYHEFVAVLQRASFCVTDSGGVQQEACIVGVPAVTIMDETPWPDTISNGANELCRPAVDPITPAIGRAMQKSYATSPWSQPFGDGDTGARILQVLVERFGTR